MSYYVEFDSDPTNPRFNDAIDDAIAAALGGGGSSSGGGGGSSAAPKTTYDAPFFDPNTGHWFQRDSNGQLHDIGAQAPAPKPVPANPLDTNGDGLIDGTQTAVGVTQVPTSISPTGWTLNGVPVYSNGAPYVPPTAASHDITQLIKQSGPNGSFIYLNPDGSIAATQQAGQAVQWANGSGGGGGLTGNGGGGTGNSGYQVGPGVGSGTIIGPYGQPVGNATYQASAPPDTSGMTADQAAAAQRDWQASENAKQRAFQAQQNALDRAIQEQSIALQKQGVAADVADKLAAHIADTNPGEYEAFLLGGGGDVFNALAGGGTALGPQAMGGAAALLGVSRGLGGGGLTGATGDPSGGGTTLPGGSVPTPTDPAVGALGNRSLDIRRAVRSNPELQTYLNSTANKMGAGGPTFDSNAGYGEGNFAALPGFESPNMAAGLKQGNKYVIDPSTGQPYIPPTSHQSSDPLGANYVDPRSYGPTPLVAAPNSPLVTPKPAITPKAIVTMAGGGLTNAAAAITGDATGGAIDAGGARPELVVNPTHAPIGVVPYPQMQKWMAPGGRGMMKNAQLARIVHRMGMLGASGMGGGNGVSFNASGGQLPMANDAASGFGVDQGTYAAPTDIPRYAYGTPNWGSLLQPATQTTAASSFRLPGLAAPSHGGVSYNASGGQPITATTGGGLTGAGATTSTAQPAAQPTIMQPINTAVPPTAPTTATAGGGLTLGQIQTNATAGGGQAPVINPQDLAAIQQLRTNTPTYDMNPLDVGFTNADPYLQNQYAQGMALKYGIPADSLLWNAQNQAIRGGSLMPRYNQPITLGV